MKQISEKKCQKVANEDITKYSRGTPKWVTFYLRFLRFLGDFTIENVESDIFI